MHSPSALSYALPSDPTWKRCLVRTVERLTGARTVRRRYKRVSDAASHDFWSAALEALGVEIQCPDAVEDRVPQHGPLVAVSNHPFGILDGLTLCEIIGRRRSDFKILVHHALCRTGRFQDHFLPIDFREGDQAHRANVRTLRTALHHVRRGGCMALFPAGGIATATPWFSNAVDLPWKPFAARLVAATGAPALPLYVRGQNSRAFHLASRISTSLRLALIMSEVRRRMGSTLHVRVGNLIDARTLTAYGDPEAQTEFLRTRTLELASA